MTQQDTTVQSAAKSVPVYLKYDYAVPLRVNAVIPNFVCWFIGDRTSKVTPYKLESCNAPLL